MVNIYISNGKIKMKDAFFFILSEESQKDPTNVVVR